MKIQKRKQTLLTGFSKTKVLLPTHLKAIKGGNRFIAEDDIDGLLIAEEDLEGV